MLRYAAFLRAAILITLRQRYAMPTLFADATTGFDFVTFIDFHAAAMIRRRLRRHHWHEKAYVSMPPPRLPARLLAEMRQVISRHTLTLIFAA